MTHALNDSYGGNDLRIYAHLEDVLGVRLGTPAVREGLHRSFLALCDRLGLPSRGLERMVDLYLLHAGVPRAHVQQLIEAFQRQHDLFGAPPVDSSTLLNRWEDDALEFLHPTVITPRRSILWDETAWHARLYARVAANPTGFLAKSPFESYFAECFDRAGKERARVGLAAALPPRPRLVWDADGLALRLPRANGRIAVQMDDAARPLRLKGGEDWALEQPWPKRLSGLIDGMPFALEFLADDGHFAVFDLTVGQFLWEGAANGLRDLMLDTSEALVAARRPFTLDNLESVPLGDGCFLQRALLDQRPKVLRIGGQSMTLATRPRRRLGLTGGVIAIGRQGRLFGPHAVVRVETGLQTNETRRMRMRVAGVETVIDVAVTEGLGECALADFLPPGLPSRPARLRLELLAPDREARSAGITFGAFVWPGFECARGLDLICSAAPSNFLPSHSQHVTSFEGGLQLDPKGGYAHATAAFGIEGEVVPFHLVWPDISLQRLRSDGAVSPVPLGARIGVGAEDRFGHVSIRCPDRGAALRVGARHEAQPFALGMTRNIAISELVGRNAAVVLRRSNGAEVVLFEVVDALQPARFDLRLVRVGVQATFAISTAIDAVAVEAEDEMGKRSFHEIALGRRPVRRAASEWLRAELSGTDARDVTLTIAQQPANQGLMIGKIFVRPDIANPDLGWRPLRNGRGDTYALPLTASHSLSDAPVDFIQTRFETLCRWLSDCYAVDCWLDHGLERSLLPRWRKLGAMIAGLPLSSGLLMRAALLPMPGETSPSWVPMVHPVEIDPGLYSALPAAFDALADQTDDGLRAGSMLSAFSRERLREGLLHAQALIAFANATEAERNAETVLAGFRPERFFKLFAPLDTDAGAGWFWHGTPIMGPAHLRAAQLRMLERFEAANVLFDSPSESGGNSRRAEALSTLALHVLAQCPPVWRPPMPKRRPEDDRPHAIDLAVAATLSEFARASRTGSARQFIDTLATTLSWRPGDVLASVGFLLRLAPELFFYFLLVWQLAKVRP
ncbi:hypothetical protein L0V05_07730 [Tabrizicola sp. J26]|nr:hypothetical protein [Tabrizicola rongguiensis]